MILATRLPIIQTAEGPERLRGLGDSSGDENGSDAMKYWEIIADNLSKAGFSWGGSQPLIPTGEQFGLLMHIATTENVSVIHADELLTAFMELESAIRASGGH